MKTKLAWLIILLSILSLFITGCSSNDDSDGYYPGDDTEIKLANFKVNTVNHYGIADGYQTVSLSSEGSMIHFWGAYNHYNFYGYFTEANGQGMRATDEEGYLTEEFRQYCKDHLDEEITVYCYATLKDCTITLVTNTEQSFEPITAKCTESVELPMEVEKTGYTFRGWSTDSDDWTGSDYVYCDDTEVTAYAIFSPITTYVRGRAMYSDYRTGSVEYDSNYTLEYVEYFGYNFTGYFSEENGEGIQYTDNRGNSLSPWKILPGDAYYYDIYAHYVPAESYTITLPNEGIKRYITVTYVDYYGDGKNLEKTYTSGSKIEYLVPPNIDNRHVFDGWYEEYLLTHEFMYDTPVTNDIKLYPKITEVGDLSALHKTIITSDINEAMPITVQGDHIRSYVCGYSGTLNITISYSCTDDDVLSVGGPIHVPFGLRNGESVSTRISVEAGKIITFTFNSHNDTNNKGTVYYTLSGLDRTDREVEVDIPDEFEIRVTNGNTFKLKVFQYDNYIFRGYYTERDGKGERVTDENGKSIGTYEFGNDVTLYAYYVEKDE